MAFQRKGVVILATDGPDVADPLGRLALRGDLEPITDQRPERFAMNGAIAAHRHTAHALGPAGDHDIARPRHDLSNRSEEHTSELQSLLRISYADFCLQK